MSLRHFLEKALKGSSNAKNISDAWQSTNLTSLICIQIGDGMGVECIRGLYATKVAFFPKVTGIMQELHSSRAPKFTLLRASYFYSASSILSCRCTAEGINAFAYVKEKRKRKERDFSPSPERNKEKPPRKTACKNLQNAASFHRVIKTQQKQVSANSIPILKPMDFEGLKSNAFQFQLFL